MQSLTQIASVALFVQRTQAIQPGFQLTVENTDDIAAICSRLEGMPLAIELAAEQSTVLSPRALLSRLEHPLEVLMGSRRDAPEKQRCISPTIQESRTAFPLRIREQLLQPSYSELTVREIEVLRLLAMGLSNKGIAERLVLSPHTVNVHLHSIFNKLDVHSRSAATRYALDHQLA